MINIFNYLDYRKFLLDWIQGQKNQGHGVRVQIAKAASISSTMLSLILSGDKELTPDQGIEVCEYLGLSADEEDFFLELIQFSRASNHKLKKRLTVRIDRKKEQAKKISERIKDAKELSDKEKSIYYSSWIYSGVNMLTAIDEFGDIHAIADKLKLPVPVISQVVDFLLKNGICELKNDKLSYGSLKTHIGSDSPFVNRHHQNWRLRGFEKMEHNKDSDMFFTGPMALSVQDAEKIRELLPKYIEEILKIVWPSESEKAYCLNLDWFEF